MMRRAAVLAFSVLLIGACGGSASSERQVLVDYSSDEVTMFVAQNFPKKVSVVPGQTVVFKQTWTGEPHTVTGGTFTHETLTVGSDLLTMFNGYVELAGKNDNMVDPEGGSEDTTVVEFFDGLRSAKPIAKRNEVVAAYKRLAAKYGWADYDNPPDQPFSVLNDQIDAIGDPLFEKLLYAFDQEGADGLAQNIGQPCFLDKGAVPKDPNTPCTKAEQKQPEFDGTQSVYNSGVLRYEGAQGNTFRVKLADNTKPGTYLFYCAVHGPGQLSEVEVRKPGSKVPSATAVRRAGRDEARDATLPLEKTYRNAVRTNKTRVNGEEITGPFAGLPTEIHASINEFVPNVIRTKVGEPVTWKMIGADHTISFDVPPYLPIIQFGTKFRLNPKIENPAGGAPARPEHDEGDGEGDEGPPEPEAIDGGTYDGSGFWSSGLVGAEPYLAYTLRFAKAGTYPYACLIHPKMIGRVVVT